MKHLGFGIRGKFIGASIFAVIIIWAVASALGRVGTERLVIRFGEVEHQTIAKLFLDQNHASIAANNGFELSRKLNRMMLGSGLEYLAIIKCNGEVLLSSEMAKDKDYERLLSDPCRLGGQAVLPKGRTSLVTARPFEFFGQGQTMGFVVAGASPALQGELEFILRFMNAVYSVGFLLVGIIGVFGIQYFTSPLSALLSELKSIDLLGKGLLRDKNQNIPEIAAARNAINVTLKKLYELQERVEKETRRLAFADLAAQVAHDIRSPLSALNTVRAQMSDIVVPEEFKKLLEIATSRIADIASSLLKNKSEIQKATNNQQLEKVPVRTRLPILCKGLEDLILEKKASSSNEIVIEWKRFLENTDGDVLIDGPEFVRVVSNVIQNAIESYEHAKGSVIVIIRREREFFVVQISDAGRGIPESVLPRLGEDGFSFEKAAGNGLGLFHAKSTLEKSGGSINIDSKRGVGTTVTLRMRLQARA